MRSFFLKKIAVLVSCVAFLSISVNAADDPSKLKNIVSQIDKVKTDLTQKEKRQTSIQQQLKILQRKIVFLEAKYKDTTKKLKQQQTILAKLTKDQVKQQLKLHEGQKKLASQINLVYQIKQPDYFKIIFGHQVTITPSVLLGYHRYVFMARLNQMHNIKQILKHLEQNRQKIKQQAKSLARLENKQQQQKLELELTRQEQNKTLDSLKSKIALQNKKLKQLLIAKRNLENLIADLAAHRLGAMSPELKAKVCRNFVWPTKGEITTHFGSPIEQSSWKWNGVLIQAAENQEIRSMSAGKVIYGGWFTGYGLLLIIDHGHGYMSLYGHNNRLRKKLDANVEAGEVVATIGKTGSEKPALYFAIRYNGRPIDPEKWCR